MIGLAIGFPTGRYHATPWGTHVNEAAVEWPPSPWRLLRALASAWHRTAPDLSRDEVTGLLDALAEPPRYRLPEVAPAHSRHYMPERGHRREVEPKQTLVFDAFLRLVDREDRLFVTWEVELTETQRSALRRLASGLSYLGRAESWCEIEVVQESGGGMEVSPIGPGGIGAEQEIVRLLTPLRPLDLGSLEVTTSELQSARRRLKDPPGARWVRYARPLDWAAGTQRRAKRRRPRSSAHAVLWALDGRPLPLLTEAEEVVSAVRAHLRLSQTTETGALRVFAYPSSDARSQRPPRVDRVVLLAERGLSERELARACDLPAFGAPGLSSPQTPLLLGFGAHSDLGGPIFGPGREWESVTPVLPTVERGLRSGRAAPATPQELIASAIPPQLERPRVVGQGEPPVRWLEFRRGAALGARLEFPTPVRGPLVAERQPPGFGLFLCVA